MDKRKSVIPKCAIPNGVTDISAVKALHQMIKPKQGMAQDVRDELSLKPNEVFSACEKRLPKRGKDIKCFADLPPDVQNTINMMSRRDGKIDPIDKARRTKIAIHYQTTCFGAQGM